MYLCVVGAEEGAVRTDSSSSMVESQQVKPKIEKKKEIMNQLIAQRDGDGYQKTQTAKRVEKVASEGVVSGW